MAVIPTLDDLARQIADQDRRLQALESSAQLGNSSIRGGSLYVLDDTTPPGIIAVLGKVDEPGTSTIYNGAIIEKPGVGTPFLWMNDHAGQLLPYSPWDGWHTPTEQVNITDTTLQDRWVTTVEIATCLALKVSIPVVCDVGTTGEILVRCAATGTVTNTKVIPSGASTVFECYWLHGMTLQSGPSQFSFQARRTSGAGTVTLFVPGPLTFGSYMVQATAGGWT